MNTRQITLVQTSFDAIQPRLNIIGQRFYDRLFELDPSLKPLFHTDIETQRNKFMAMIGLITTNLNQFYAIAPAIETLGEYHISYNVPKQSYITARTALVWALAVEHGVDWTLELQTAWEAAYDVIAATMQPNKRA